ncbi:MAG TPA: SRPBCC family protein [Kaistiaceae bacterium]|nr:SRPBCC family protein [Kaistiaceae bacterium]
MHSFSTNHRVGHSANDMFALVADVERYPEFVPLCESIHMRGRDAQGDTEIVVVDMTVAYKLIRETFTSRAVFDRPNLKIVVDYLDGPFSSLENRWTFIERGADACDVNFHIAYEFRSRALGLMMGAMFDRAFRKFSVAFEERADRIYGRKASV